MIKLHSSVVYRGRTPAFVSKMGRQRVWIYGMTATNLLLDDSRAYSFNGWVEPGNLEPANFSNLYGVDLHVVNIGGNRGDVLVYNPALDEGMYIDTVDFREWSKLAVIEAMGRVIDDDLPRRGLRVGKVCLLDQSPAWLWEEQQNWGEQGKQSGEGEGS